MVLNTHLFHKQAHHLLYFKIRREQIPVLAPLGRGWGWAEAQLLPESPSVIAGRATVNPGGRITHLWAGNKVPAVNPEGPQGSPWAGL